MQYKVSMKAARVNAELNLAEAADKIGVSISTVKNWEAKKTFPNQPMIERICAVYAIPYDMLKFF
jgi:transcriptional regulator with XRE-family HTH domain